MKYFSIIATLLIISGCSKKHPDITIYNETDKYFDSVHVQATQGRITSFKEIEQSSKHKSQIFFDSSMTGDGGYVLYLFNELDTTMTYAFGYYTNGVPLNRQFVVRILNDTIVIEGK